MQPKYKVWDNVEFKDYRLCLIWTIKQVNIKRFLFWKYYQYDITETRLWLRDVHITPERDIYWVIK